MSMRTRRNGPPDPRYGFSGRMTIWVWVTSAQS